MLPRLASLISCAALVLLMANTSNAAPSKQTPGVGDRATGVLVSEGELTKRDGPGTCPAPDAALKAFWDDISYGPGDYGCHKGYCWSRCAGGARIFGSVARDGIYEWCYTTKGRSQDRGYVTCSKKEDCCNTWSCAGPCAAF